MKLRMKFACKTVGSLVRSRVGRTPDLPKRKAERPDIPYYNIIIYKQVMLMQSTIEWGTQLYTYPSTGRLEVTESGIHFQLQLNRQQLSK